MKSKFAYRIFSFTAAIVLCTTVVSCSKSSQNDNSSMTEQPVKISVGIWPQETDKSATSVWEKYEEIMKKKYPNITLVPERLSYSFDTFITMAASGTLPTIFQTYFTEPKRLIANNVVADITDYAEKYGFIEGQREDILSIATENGRLYGIARDAYALALFINMNLFKKAGLVDKDGLPVYPKTFDQLAEIAKTIKEKTGKPGFFLPNRDGVGGWHFCNIAWAFGAELQYQDSDGRWRSGIGSPEAVKALKYVYDLKWKYGVVVDNSSLGWGDWIMNFATDEVGMVFAAPDAMRNLVINYSMDKNAIAAVPVPAGPGGHYALMGGTFYMFAANATEEQLDAGFKLLEIIGMTPKATDQMIESIKYELEAQVNQNIPVGPRTINVWTDQNRIKVEQELYDKYTNVNMRLFRDYYDGQESRIRKEYPMYCQGMYRTLDNCIRSVLTDKNSSPEQLLTKASQEFENFYLSGNN